MTPYTPEAEARILEGWLPQHFDGAKNVVVTDLTESKGGGWSARIVFVDITFTRDDKPEQQKLVIRFLPGYHLFLGANLEVQWQFTHALNVHSAVPVPAAIGLEQNEAILGQAFYVMERLEGRVALQSPNYNLEGWITELDLPARKRLWSNALETMAALHNLDWHQGFTFLDRPEYGEPGLDQLLNWMVAWRDWAAKGRRLPTLAAAVDYLLANRPSSAPVSVLWGDPTPSNVVWRDDLSVAGLIDFESATLGPAEADLGWWQFMNNLLSVGYRIPRLEGLPSPEETIEIYQTALGRPVENMFYYDILAATRMAIVAVRSMDMHIEMGNIRPDNDALTNNPITEYLATRLDLPIPVIGEGFRAYTANLFPMGDEEE